MCDSCSKKSYPMAIGKCSGCIKNTSSISHVYCTMCAVIKNVCKACGK